jgi:hypothetical protein
LSGILQRQCLTRTPRDLYKLSVHVKPYSELDARPGASR